MPTAIAYRRAPLVDPALVPLSDAAVHADGLQDLRAVGVDLKTIDYESILGYLCHNKAVSVYCFIENSIAQPTAFYNRFKGSNKKIGQVHCRSEGASARAVRQARRNNRPRAEQICSARGDKNSVIQGIFRGQSIIFPLPRPLRRSLPQRPARLSFCPRP